MTNKITKTQIEMLESLLRRGSKAGCSGVVPASEWTNGSGRYTTSRALPPYTEKFRVTDLRAELGRVQKLLKLHPKTRVVVAVTNIRAARKAVADYHAKMEQK